MPELWLLLPGSIESRTGGTIYDSRLAAALREIGWSVEIRELDASFPWPSAEAREGAVRTFGAIASNATVLVDGLALGVLPAEVTRERARLRLVGLVHHPLALETGLEPATVADLAESERQALAAVRHVVVTSRETAAALNTYGVPPSRVSVIEPGTDPAPLAPRSGGGTVRMLCVASLTPRKGHEVLFRALARLKDDGWRLTCVGSASRDPTTAARLRELARRECIENRVRFVGELDADALAVQYDAADVFVLPTFYEGYGMAVAEALARGLPVVSTPTGGIRDLLSGSRPGDPAGSDAGILVPPGDVDALAAALARVVRDASCRERLAAGARNMRTRLPTWLDAAHAMARVASKVGSDE
jgi:glycosyltransferase involved in cell wall biosynthesis